MKHLRHIVIDLVDPKETLVVKTKKEAANILCVHVNTLVAARPIKKRFYYLPYKIM
jgi:hypothetical protein